MCERQNGKMAQLPEGIMVEPLTVAGRYAEWLKPAGVSNQRAILYAIGGGYVSGSCKDHRSMVAKLAKGSGVQILLIEHRLAPEDPYPAALEDEIAAYRWLLEQGFLPENLMIVGESAGGGLCLATLLALRDLGLPLPSAAVAISPWTDLTLSGESHLTKRKVCMSPQGMSTVCVTYYVGSQDPRHPWISPLFGDLKGLPPILISVGDADTLFSDSTRFAEKAQIAGVDLTLSIGENQMHCYPLLAPLFPEATRAMQEICDFIRSHIGVPAGQPVAVQAI
jgi:acetyl esterase/lipase